MERFVRNMLAILPPLDEIAARYGTDYARLSGALSAYYDAARSALRQVAERDPEEDDDDDTVDHGDPIADLEVPPLDDESVDYSLPVMATAPTRHDLRAAMSAPTAGA